MEFIDMLKKRRSIRQYTKEAVTGEQLQLVINAGLLSPSSRSIRPWELIVVQNKDTLKKMSECRVGRKNAGKCVCRSCSDSQCGKIGCMDGGLFNCDV